MVRSQAIVALGKTFEESAEIDVDFCRAFNAIAHRIECVFQIAWQGIFEIWGKGSIGKLVLDRYRGLLAPNREFLVK